MTDDLRRASSVKAVPSLALPFPLRPGYMAQLIIPRDLTTADADRLCAFIRSLVAPHEQEQGVSDAQG